MLDNFKKIMDVVEEAKSFGYKKVKNGTRLYGYVPHVAPQAWFHEIYPPLSSRKIKILEKTMQIKIPSDYKDFLQETNGINLFSDILSLDGYVNSYNRIDFDNRQPYDITTPNTINRIKEAPKSWFYIGGYGLDGSQLVLNMITGEVYRCKGWTINILNKWSDFWTMLNCEAERISKLFNEKGVRIKKEISTTPEIEKNIKIKDEIFENKTDNTKDEKRGFFNKLKFW